VRGSVGGRAPALPSAHSAGAAAVTPRRVWSTAGEAAPQRDGGQRRGAGGVRGDGGFLVGTRVVWGLGDYCQLGGGTSCGVVVVVVVAVVVGGGVGGLGGVA